MNKIRRILTSQQASRFLSVCAAALCLVAALAPMCFANTGGAFTGVEAIDNPITNFYDLLFGLLRAVGIGCAIWGVVQFLISFLSSHDPTQRINAIFALFAGVCLIFIREILGFFGISV